MTDPATFQPLRDVIAATAADLSNGNPFWTAGCLADALIKALIAAGWQITPPPGQPAPEAYPEPPLPDAQLANGGACS